MFSLQTPVFLQQHDATATPASHPTLAPRRAFDEPAEHRRRSVASRAFSPAFLAHNGAYISGNSAKAKQERGRENGTCDSSASK